MKNENIYHIRHNDLEGATSDIESPKVDIFNDLNLERGQGLIIWAWDVILVDAVPDGDNDKIFHGFTKKQFTGQPNLMTEDDLKEFYGQTVDVIEALHYIHDGTQSVFKYETSKLEKSLIGEGGFFIWSHFYDTTWVTGTPATTHDIITVIYYEVVKISDEYARRAIDILQQGPRGEEV